MAKNLPAIWETQVPSLGQEDPLEKEMETHSSTLAWKIPWMEESGGLVHWSERVGHDRVANSFTFKTIWGSGNEMERDPVVLPPASPPLWPGPPPAFVSGKTLAKH